MNMTFKEFFIIARKRLLIAALLSIFLGAGISFLLHESNMRMKTRNNTDRNAFISAKRDIDKVDGAFIAEFAAQDNADMNTRMAQRGHLALLDNSEAEKLFGYDELARILVTRTVDVSVGTGTPAARHVFPDIKLLMFVLPRSDTLAEVNSFTTLVRYSAEGQTQSLILKWERDSKGEWTTNSLPADYSVKNVEVSRLGISFILESRKTLTSSSTYVLQTTER